MHSPYSWHRRVAGALLTAALTTACTGNPAAPSESGRPAIDGAAVSAVDGAAATGVDVRVGSHAVTTDAAGHFSVPLDPIHSYPVVVSGSSVIERRTTIGGGQMARVSVMPATFDGFAFDEMFRAGTGRLRRWTTRPVLVVLGSVMTYRGVANDYAATNEALSETELSSLVDDLTAALSLLTGGTFTSFAQIIVERPGSGDRVPVFRDGAIVVGRYNGIVTFARTIGYGTWAEAADGAVVGGAMFLDRDFDKDDARRTLLRTHELGHALGYMHVESRTSIMNPSIGPEPTAFDRAAAIVAFQRPPGNVAPDTDPAFTTPPASGFGGRARWAAPVACTLAGASTAR